MPARNGETNYNTNLASEFLMMSILHRIGKHAYLSLGNKKAVDILIKTTKGSICILEVKGVNKKTDDWLIGNSGVMPIASGLFYALVSFESKIQDALSPATFYIIPSVLLQRTTEYKINKNGKTVYLSHKYIRENYSRYLNNLDCLNEYLGDN